MKYQVRNGERGDFEVESVEVEESKTRHWIAKRVVIAILALIAFVVVWPVFAGGPTTASEFLPMGERILLLVLGYYFGKL